MVIIKYYIFYDIYIYNIYIYIFAHKKTEQTEHRLI